MGHMAELLHRTALCHRRANRKPTLVARQGAGSGRTGWSRASSPAAGVQGAGAQARGRQRQWRRKGSAGAARRRGGLTGALHAGARLRPPPFGPVGVGSGEGAGLVHAELVGVNLRRSGVGKARGHVHGQGECEERGKVQARWARRAHWARLSARAGGQGRAGRQRPPGGGRGEARPAGPPACWWPVAHPAAPVLRVGSPDDGRATGAGLPVVIQNNVAVGLGGGVGGWGQACLGRRGGVVHAACV